MTAFVKLVQASEALIKHQELHLPVLQLFPNGVSCWQNTLPLTDSEKILSKLQDMPITSTCDTVMTQVCFNSLNNCNNRYAVNNM